MATIGGLQFGLSSVAALSAGISAAVLMAGWSRRARVLARQAEPGSAEPFARFELGRTPFASSLLDVAAEVRAVLGYVAPFAAQRFVQLEFAVQPELAVHADSRVLREVVSDLVTNAIRHAPCGRVLVGGMRHGGRVQISVTDDGVGPPEAEQEAALRDAERLIALQGGTIHVEAHPPGEGSTVLVRLPELAVTTRAVGPASPGGGGGAPPATRGTAHGPAAGSTAASLT